MSSIDSFKTLSLISIEGKKYFFYDLNKIAILFGFDLNTLPVSLKILLENLLRNEDGETITNEVIKNFCNNLLNHQNTIDISFYPTSIINDTMVLIT